MDADRRLVIDVGREMPGFRIRFRREISVRSLTFWRSRARTQARVGLEGAHPRVSGSSCPDRAGGTLVAARGWNPVECGGRRFQWWRARERQVSQHHFGPNYTGTSCTGLGGTCLA